MSAKSIFEKLVDRAFSWQLFFSRRPTKPGELIEKLSPEEREELQNLTSKDVEPVDNRLQYLQGAYPESTATVHTLFPNKKDDNES